MGPLILKKRKTTGQNRENICHGSGNQSDQPSSPTNGMFGIDDIANNLATVNVVFFKRSLLHFPLSRPSDLIILPVTSSHFGRGLGRYHVFQLNDMKKEEDAATPFRNLEEMMKLNFLTVTCLEKC